jgi:hypothetical protein
MVVIASGPRANYWSIANIDMTRPVYPTQVVLLNWVFDLVQCGRARALATSP